jgi:hypothetical protein
MSGMVTLVTPDNVADYNTKSASREKALQSEFETLWHVN